MKKKLLIGKLNEYNQSLYSFLGSEYRVQFSTDNVESVKNMIYMERADIVMLSLVDLDNNPELFDEVQKADAPLFLIGSYEMYNAMRSNIYSKRMMFLENDSNEKILQQCRIQFGENVVVDIESVDNPEYIIHEKEQEAPKKTILVVDDSALTLRNMKRILEPKYKSVLVSNGSQAVSQIDKRKPDLIILDYEMPVCNGERIFKLLQLNPNTRDIPIIFLTGLSDKANTVALLKLNPAGYFLKPPDTGKLMEKIDEILSK